MCFVPGTNFCEFIPEDEHLRSKADSTYQPRTVLLDEVEPGQRYEIVFTGLKGACFVRYRIGDMIKIVSLRDDELGVDIPQMDFVGRCDHIIDLAGFTRLTEAMVWQAIEDSGVPYVEWTAYKESSSEGPTLNICLEQRDGETTDTEEAAEALHQALIKNDDDYGNMDSMLGLKPVRVIWLAPGTFQQYMEEQQAAGSDLGHLKPPRMQPSQETTAELMRIHRSRSNT